MKKNIKTTIIIRESNLKDRVRLSKIVSYFLESEKPFELWKKYGDEPTQFSVKNIAKNYTDKKKEYVIWIIKLFITLLKNKATGRIFVSGFESAFVVYISTFFIKREYVFDNPDNFYQSKQLPNFLKSALLYLERKIINKALVTLVPDESRIYGYNIPVEKFEVLKNFPSKNDLKESFKNVSKQEGKLVVYINGWLVPTRGLKMISTFITNLSPGLDLKIIIAGKKEGLDSVLESSYVEYKGVVSAIASLKYYHESDLILTFYDPKLEINRKASPNKWGDAIITKTVPILNKGIETTKTYFPNGGYFSIEYGEGHELLNLVLDIYHDKSILKNKIKQLEQNPMYFWENQMDKILNR